ncbi:MAG: ferrous iron transport protein B [Blastocatellia bacterium]|nr:MAG: ferrous iron transport protein B [Blastocatellia bacterium]
MSAQPLTTLSSPHTAGDKHQYTVAVAGNPNAGKTTLFNALTGLRQKVANYPGVTVETKSGVWALDEQSSAVVVDLPGLYSLNATSIDEQIARDVLLGRESSNTRKLPNPDVILLVVDATNLSRNLYLTTQVIESGAPVVVALTMFDLAQRSGMDIDVELLSAELGAPVVPVVARKRSGLDVLAKTVASVARSGRARHQVNVVSEKRDSEEFREILVNRYRHIEEITRKTFHRGNRAQVDLTSRIDSIVTHKVFGPVVLIAVMLLVFQTIFSWANLPMSLIENVFSQLSSFVRATLPPGLFTDLLADGVIAGVGGVLVFLPQILLLFFFISMLEDSGYMARAAFLIDRLMRGLGLDGKAFLPLLSSFACAVPGIMATRTIENRKDRFATMMVAPFMSCSARLPVYTLMIAACFSRQRVFGFLSLGVLIILTMYTLGIVVAIAVAWVLKRTILNAPAPPFVMELPIYRVPNFTNVAQTMFTSAGLFVKRAGTVILAISILLWALTAFPRAGANIAPAQQVSDSFAGRAGRFIEPAIKPLGFDWKIGIGLITSFAARETIVSTLNVVYNVGDEGQGSSSLVDTMLRAKRPDGTPVWTPLVAVSLMVFFVLACQCMSTLAIVRRETNSWRWPLFMVSYMLVLAYVASLLTFQGGKLLGFS